METPQQDGTVVPLLILDPKGEVVATALQNDKSRNKSLEQKSLWVVDGATGRVLPWTAGGTYHGPAGTAGVKFEGPGETAVVDGFTKGPDGWPIRQDAEGVHRAHSGPKDGDQGSRGVNQPIQTDANFLYELEGLIKRRKVELPEGSYTTHLFKAGTGKIRKKTGEEAIELILADTNETVASEASDLLYHMTVLFVDLGVSWHEVLDTLKKR